MSECFLYSPDTLKGVSSQIPDRSTDATQIIRFPDYEATPIPTFVQLRLIPGLYPLLFAKELRIPVQSAD